MLPKTIRGPQTLATTASAGLMSAADKQKLNTIIDDTADSTSTTSTWSAAKVAQELAAAVPTSISDLTDDSDFLTNTEFEALIGANSGLATLDSSGKVPSSQLPSYVDDVLEYSDSTNFPATGEASKIYVDTTSNKTYRWGGSEYVEISESLALGETESTAYRGDRGKVAYDHAAAKGSAYASGLYKITTNAEGHVTAAEAVTKTDITGLGIPAQDTTYQSLAAAENGTDISLVSTGEKYVWNNSYLPLSGGTVTGNITYKSTIIDASKADNNVSSIYYPTTFNILDSGNRILTRKEAVVNPNGDISAYWYVRNYDTSGAQVGQKGIKMNLTKSGVFTYTIDEADKFRSAISAVSTNGDTITGTLILSKATDCSGLSNNEPALIVGGTTTTSHLEFDSNEIMAKSNATTPIDLYLNADGAPVHLCQNHGTADTVYADVRSDLDASSTSTGAFRVFGGVGIAKKLYVGDTTQINNILTLHRESSTTDNLPAGIIFHLKDTTVNAEFAGGFIYAYHDHTSPSYGTNMVINAGGTLMISGGEAASNLYPTYKGSTAENAYFMADNIVYMYANANTIANRIGFALTTAGAIVPQKAEAVNNNAQNIGASDNKWANVYATTFNGALSGNATTATTADKLTGFASRASTMTWGNQTGSVITCFATSGGGGWGFRDNNPASGQTSMTIDGTVYIKEGVVDIGTAVKSFSVSGTTVTYTTLWGNTSTFTTQDTKNTAGSTNSTSKLFLIGATSQAANPTTNSYSKVFETNGALSAKTLGINADTDADKVTLQWNPTDQSVDFVFA